MTSTLTSTLISQNLFVILSKAKDLPSYFAGNPHQSGCPTLAALLFLRLGWDTTTLSPSTSRPETASYHPVLDHHHHRPAQDDHGDGDGGCCSRPAHQVHPVHGHQQVPQQLPESAAQPHLPG